MCLHGNFFPWFCEASCSGLFRWCVNDALTQSLFHYYTVFFSTYFLITTIVFPCFAWCYNYIHYIHYIHIGVLFMLRVVSRIKLEVHSLCGSVYGGVVSGQDIYISVYLEGHGVGSLFVIHS